MKSKNIPQLEDEALNEVIVVHDLTHEQHEENKRARTVRNESKEEGEDVFMCFAEVTAASSPNQSFWS